MTAEQRRVSPLLAIRYGRAASAISGAIYVAAIRLRLRKAIRPSRSAP